jgi:hypothetical protein
MKRKIFLFMVGSTLALMINLTLRRFEYDSNPKVATLVMAALVPVLSAAVRCDVFALAVRASRGVLQDLRSAASPVLGLPTLRHHRNRLRRKRQVHFGEGLWLRHGLVLGFPGICVLCCV